MAGSGVAFSFANPLAGAVQRYQTENAAGTPPWGGSPASAVACQLGTTPNTSIRALAPQIPTELPLNTVALANASFVGSGGKPGQKITGGGGPAGGGGGGNGK